MVKVLVTGGAGFIGSNLIARLLEQDEVDLVRAVDDLSTGVHKNIQPFLTNPRFEFVEGDICNYQDCLQSAKGIDVILHEAALGSVPRSISNPVRTNEVNITGTLNVFNAARESGTGKIIFAASSSTYGDSKSLPKKEEVIGNPLSPYAVTKLVNELYASVFGKVYGLNFIGFRYFNVFGPNQNPQGPYAAVIPLFFSKMLSGQSPVIFGDGTQSRDFTYVSNVVDANMNALFCDKPESWNQIYNIACGEKTTLNDLFRFAAELTNFHQAPVYEPPRTGDIRDSLADISKAKRLLNYQPSISVKDGLQLAYDWYKSNPGYFD